MLGVAALRALRDASIEATTSGPPRRIANPFFGVGPITDGTLDDVDSRLMRFEFERWLEKNYRKFDDRGRDIGAFSAAEIGRSMHRGYPADKILLDMMREIHRYFEFPRTNKMVVGLGGGHSGFTASVLHLVSANDKAQHIFVDTPAPESTEAMAGGFFRQSWGAQIVEMMRCARGGDEDRIHFASREGAIPDAATLKNLGVKLFIGVGHETTGATTYSNQDIASLLDWIDRDPVEHHAVLDATSMLGAMPWGEAVVRQVMAKCCMFTPFQKAIGGISGYYIISLTPHALELIERNQERPSWAIPRQLKIAVPVDPKKPLSGKRSVTMGPIYDPVQDKMLGGVINTFSSLAFAETTFGLLRVERRIGSVAELNRRSVANRQAVNEWVASSSMFEHGVADPEIRGAAVTLLRVTDGDITDPAIHGRIVARSKQLLSYDGITHPNGVYERGLDVARYINAFPGTPGDYRAWVGGIRSKEDVVALLENLRYAYHRSRIVVLEEELEKHGVTIESPATESARARKDDPNRAYKVLICDPIGLRFDNQGRPDHSEVRRYIETNGGEFHNGPIADEAKLEKGRIHFFYQPDLSTGAEILSQTDKGQFDAVIAAATFIANAAVFKHGGVRIGAGTGNMGSASWGGGNGAGGEAPLMNTPTFNSRATAQMVFKALLKVAPDLPVGELHQRVVAGDFDTGKNLRDFPTEKLEGKKLAILGYGNIGREVARIARAFGMRVAIHARSQHKEWIESEGFEYAATPEGAALGADVLSPHLGLGPLNTTSRTYANAGVVGAAVLNAMNDGAILINYDRGEIVDVAALDAALASGKIRYAAIDADIFKDAGSGVLSGPMLPYLEIEGRHQGKLELLPHAAADTEHLSRVEGAKQAVDQIFDCIRYKVVTNLKGDLPEGYSNAGARTVPGVGKVSRQDIDRAVGDPAALCRARDAAETMAAVWGAMAATSDLDRRGELVARYGASLVLCFNRYASLMRELGLEGPYDR